jgi:hypothetical protein
MLKGEGKACEGLAVFPSQVHGFLRLQARVCRESVPFTPAHP